MVYFHSNSAISRFTYFEVLETQSQFDQIFALQILYKKYAHIQIGLWLRFRDFVFYKTRIHLKIQQLNLFQYYSTSIATFV
jgi:hypothetical protein